MITLTAAGQYKLIETKHQTKILYLDEQTYAWIEPMQIGEILVATSNTYQTGCVLSIGSFRLYDVDDEPDLSDQQHIELEVGQDYWQGYLLPTGLPSADKKRSRLIPTTEVITENPHHNDRISVTQHTTH